MSGALIGRHVELQRAVDALKLARTGQTTTIIVRGEPGIGKSRFLEALLAQAELFGHRVLAARLDDLDRYIPFAAFASALREPLAAERDEELKDTATELQAALTAAGAAETGATMALSQIVGQLEQVLRRWGEREPVVLAIDDLHAADTDTLTVLSLLIRRLQGDPVTFLATSRAHPPDVAAPLATAIERLGRDELAIVVDLGPLDPDDVRALARMVVDAAPDERLARVLWEATQGNPFYVEHGARSLMASGELIVRDGRARLSADAEGTALRAPTTIVYRLFDLGADARAVARALTAFRRFELDDLALLAQLSDLEPPAVERAFDALVDAHLLRPSGRGFEFTHPIVRDTLYDDLGPAERRRIHATIAAALAAARAEGRDVVLADLATHLAASAAAGDEPAIEVLVAAARQAAATAPASAAAWYDHALALLAADDQRAGVLLAEQAKALFLASQLERATAATTRALELLPDGHLRARTAALQVTMLTALGRLEQALSDSDALLAAATEPLPRLHAERGALLVQLDRFEAAALEAERALELAGDDDGARALAFRALATLAQSRGDAVETFDYFEKQMRAAEHLGPAAQLSALTTHVMHLAVFGYAREADATLAEATHLRDELGGAALRDALDVAATVVDRHMGRWDDALERARWLAIPPQPSEAWIVLAQAAGLAIHVARGNAALAQRVASEIEEAPLALGTAAWARALYAAMLGEIERAVGLLEEAWRRTHAAGRLVEAPYLLGELVDIELARGNERAARSWTDTLAEITGSASPPTASTVSARCRAFAYGHAESGRYALEVAQQHGLVLDAAYAQLALGGLGVEPTANLRAAYDTYRDLGAETMRRRVAHAMKAAGVDTPRNRRTRAGDLTETELTLSRLVHDGLTNRQIANVLMVSPKTVEVYLSRLFAKLGCASRIELAVAVSEGRIPASSSD
jgi:DNA-binding CsgD family transcriptional regulator/tetratricopeptide (TPR) repeat protein